MRTCFCGNHDLLCIQFDALFCAGLRGAVAFALAMRNTVSVPRQMMLTSVLTVVLVTVIVNGGATMSVLTFLKIRLVLQCIQFERLLVAY